ncbi:ABC-type Na+ efflux pump permease subunit [Lachnospiraceae bacterium PF1-22]|uniref:ABC transporter permease subunit n=1 Tax=Ohessyouella blattaphilus TaxID=2949333 RepID=UPI003E32CAAB
MIISKMQLAIAKKDMGNMLKNKNLFLPLTIVPIMFSVFMPTLFVLIMLLSPLDRVDMEGMDKLFAQLPGNSQDLRELGLNMFLNYILPVFFIIIPVMAASVMAAGSFVGEKEKSTLETLFYSPLSLRQIFEAKIMASVSLSVMVTYASFILMILTVELEVFLITGKGWLPGVNWPIILILLAPAISLIAVALIVKSSAKAQTMEEAQQKSGFLVLPLVLLMVGQFTGLFLLKWWLLLILGALLAVIAGIVTKMIYGDLDYEKVLK